MYNEADGSKPPSNDSGKTEILNLILNRKTTD